MELQESLDELAAILITLSNVPTLDELVEFPAEKVTKQELTNTEI